MELDSQKFYLIEIVGNAEEDSEKFIRIITELGAIQVPNSNAFTYESEPEKFYLNFYIKYHDVIPTIKSTPKVRKVYDFYRYQYSESEFPILREYFIDETIPTVSSEHGNEIAIKEKNVFYGVCKSKKHGFVSWISRKKSGIPVNALMIKSDVKEIAVQEAEKLLKEYLDKPIFVNSSVKNNFDIDKYIGRVGYHTHDGVRHTFLCVSHDYALEEVQDIVITSHPSWSKYFRGLSQEEIAFFAVPFKRKSYVAPVIRNFVDISWDTQFFPQDLVKNLENEFFAPDLMNARSFEYKIFF